MQRLWPMAYGLWLNGKALCIMECLREKRENEI